MGHVCWLSLSLGALPGVWGVGDGSASGCLEDELQALYWSQGKGCLGI